MNKKKIGVFLLMCFLIPLVAAQLDLGLYEKTTDALEMIKDFLTPFFEISVGDVATSELFFAKALLLILLYVVILAVLHKVALFENKAVKIITALVISILAVRYLPEIAFIRGILIPYNVLGVALLSLFPLIIYFYFVESFDSSPIRKIAWALFAAIFIALWIVRWSDLKYIALIYLGTGILSILFIVFDKRLRAYFIISSIEKGLTTDKIRAMIDLRGKIASDEGKLGGASTSWERKYLIDEIRKNKAKLRDLARL